MNILDIDTVDVDFSENAVIIIDQTKLPGEITLKKLCSPKELYDAIARLEVRGAPAIGVAVALGMAVIAKGITDGRWGGEKPLTKENFLSAYDTNSDYLNSSRPTAVNLSWALKRMKNRLERAIEESDQPARWMEALRHEATEIRDEDISVCKRIGENGLTLIKAGDGILTHCNAGKLATVRYGTATAPMYLAKERGMNIRVYCDETRPLLQGARLTAFELYEAGLDVTLLCDNMSASLMKSGAINAIFVGCDRVAANGDTANKIGTSVVAAVAKQYGVPMYIAAPTSTIDMACESGEDITIEQRDKKEVTTMWYERPMAPLGVKVYNPAFDVTDHSQISAIVTEYGIAYPPYTESLADIMQHRE